MARSKAADSGDAIANNWNLTNVSDCLPRSLWPEKQSDIRQWDEDTIRLIRQISEIANATVKDFRAKLRAAIKARQARNTSTAGRVPYTKVTDLKAVLATYEKQKKELEPQDVPEAPAQRSTSARAKSSFKAPVTPAVPEMRENADKVGYEDSSAPARYGGEVHLRGIKPLKINMNVEQSAPAKPLRRGKKRGRDADEDDNGRPTKRPSLIHEDEDPREIDDTGFLSHHETTPREIQSRRPKRLSRLQQEHIRAPHWQHDMAPIDARSSVPPEREDLGDGDVEMGGIDLSMLTIPANATTQEQLDLWTERRNILYAAYMVKKLGIQRRAELAGNSEKIGS